MYIAISEIFLGDGQLGQSVGQKADWQVKDFQSFIQSKSRIQAFNRGGEDMTEMLQDQMFGKLDSWAIRWSYAHFQHHAVSICPVKSYIDNIGLDGSGTHLDNTKRFCNESIF